MRKMGAIGKSCAEIAGDFRSLRHSSKTMSDDQGRSPKARLPKARASNLT